MPEEQAEQQPAPQADEQHRSRHKDSKHKHKHKHRKEHKHHKHRSRERDGDELAHSDVESGEILDAAAASDKPTASDHRSPGAANGTGASPGPDQQHADR